MLRVWLIFCCATLLAGQSAAERVPRLIRDLGSADYSVREAATRELVGLGAAARDALRAAKANLPLEARLRIDAILAELPGTVGAATETLAGTTVTEDFRGKTVAEVVARLAALSGVRLVLGEPEPEGGLKPTRPDLDIDAEPAEKPDPTAAPVAPPAAVPWSQRTVAMQVHNTPLLRVLDDLCVEAGLFARRGAQGEIILNPGQGQQRGIAAYEGALKLALNNLTITRSISPGAAAWSSMHVQLQLEAEPGSAPLGLLLPLTACTAVDDKERVITASGTNGMRPQVSMLGAQRQQWLNASFEPPERDAQSIAQLVVPLRLLVPEETQVLELVPQSTSTSEDPTAARASIDAQGRLELVLPPCDALAPAEAGTVRRNDQVQLLDAAGKMVEARIIRNSDGPAGVQQTYDNAGSVTLVRVTIVRKWRISEHTFRFSDLRLP